jgi:hypothetical protein
MFFCPDLLIRAPIRQHTSSYVSIRQHTLAYVSIRQHTSAYVSLRQHTLLVYEALSYYAATLCTVGVTRVQVAVQSVAAIKNPAIMAETSLRLVTRLSTSQASL